MAIKMNEVDRKVVRGLLKKLTTHVSSNYYRYKVLFEREDGSFELIHALEKTEPQIVDKEYLKGRKLIKIYLEVAP